MTEWLSTIAAIVLGGVLTIVGGWISDRRSASRERQNRQEDRRERLASRRNEFQRESLLALQDSARRLARTCGAALAQDVAAFRTTGTWQRQQYEGDLSEQMTQAIADTMLYASRVRNEEIRTLADRLRGEATHVTRSLSEETAHEWMESAGNTMVALVDLIGTTVRELDEDA